MSCCQGRLVSELDKKPKIGTFYLRPLHPRPKVQVQELGFVQVRTRPNKITQSKNITLDNSSLPGQQVVYNRCSDNTYLKVIPNIIMMFALINLLIYYAGSTIQGGSWSPTSKGQSSSFYHFIFFFSKRIFGG